MDFEIFRIVAKECFNMGCLIALDFFKNKIVVTNVST